MPERRMLACAPADAELTVAGAVFNRHCEKCRARVMVAPSGRAALARDPEMGLLCMACAIAGFKSGEDRFAGPVSTMEETVRELSTIIDNPWRKRN
jgi:hypothetical protein